MPKYQLKTPKTLEKIVVAAYQAVEQGVTGAYQKIEDQFVETFLEKREDPEEK